MLDTSKSVQEAPIHCSWCMIKTEKRPVSLLIIRGAHYCSWDCYLAESYEKIRITAVLVILITVFFPIVILSQFPGDITPFLRYFTGFYLAFGGVFMVLLVLAYRARTVRAGRPKNSRIGK